MWFFRCTRVRWQRTDIYKLTLTLIHLSQLFWCWLFVCWNLQWSKFTNSSSSTLTLVWESQASVYSIQFEICYILLMICKIISFNSIFRITTENIQWRTGLRFLNEAARCLEEKIITSPVWLTHTYFVLLSFSYPFLDWWWYWCCIWPWISSNERRYILFLCFHYLFWLYFSGPFRFMDTYGVSKIVDLMNNYRSTYGDRFAPTQLLVDMAKENKKFYS